ncbi:MAG: hypothetical protein LC676_07495 [Loktanella sp.]|nr:hypothetical protein [Loktanella sp.]
MIRIKNNTMIGGTSFIKVRGDQMPNISVEGNYTEITGTFADVKILSEEFPILREAPVGSVSEAARELSLKPEDDRMSELTETRLGRWLKEQKFVDWARLVESLCS